MSSTTAAKIRKRMEGIVGITPKIKKVSFDKSYITLEFVDGRILQTPMKYFPSLKKVPLKDRANYILYNDGKELDVLLCNEIYHIRDFLGIPESWM